VVVDADGTARVIDRHSTPAKPTAGKKPARPRPTRPLWRRVAGRLKRALTNQQKKK
jgi:hypothetical protein